MAETELLVRKSDGTGGRKKGDIVSVKPVPNKGWAKGEGPPNYIIITINNIDAESFKTMYHHRHKPIKWNLDGMSTETVRSHYRFSDTKLAAEGKPPLSTNAITLSYTDVTKTVVDRTVEK